MFHNEGASSSIIIIIICIFILLSRESDEALYELAEELPAICLPHLDGGIPLSAFPNGITSELAGLLHTVPLMLNAKQGSCEYQFLGHWFDPTRNRTPSLPFQKQALLSTRPSDRQSNSKATSPRVFFYTLYCDFLFCATILPSQQ